MSSQYEQPHVNEHVPTKTTGTAGGSESELNELLCSIDITETADRYYIYTKDGDVYVQRKFQMLASERRMAAHEKTMIELCDVLLGAKRLLKSTSLET